MKPKLTPGTLARFKIHDFRNVVEVFGKDIATKDTTSESIDGINVLVVICLFEDVFFFGRYLCLCKGRLYIIDGNAIEQCQDTSCLT